MPNEKISLDTPQVKTPVARDFSKPAIRSALMRHVNNHWTVRYAIPMFAGTIVAGGIFGFSYPIYLSMLAVSGMGITSWVYNFFVDGHRFEKKYVVKLREIIAQKTALKRKDLSEDLAKFGSTRGLQQLELFQKKFDNLIEVLNSKFDETQLTYSRYYGIAQEVFLSGIDNLSDLVTALKTIDTMDIDYLNAQLMELEKIEKLSPARNKEFDALKRRLNSSREQKNKVHDLLAENEEALAQFDETAIAISEIERTRNKEATIGMEKAMSDLQELISRTKYFSQ
ncbi:MAG: hypothetical protein ABJF04_09140 [Reichenbachiella sp.]|uniref:hypothetical protein n=1 Tax=Reichenbachiella sp. TaxID=2184521 RepID=UPI0032671106